MSVLPSGTVAFLFTDIEGSTKRWQQDPRAMAAAVARHDELLRDIVARHGGAVFKTVGDAFCTAFPTVVPAVSAALESQHALYAEGWGEIGPIRVRMAVHAGDAEERDNDYFGPAVNRVARLLSAGHGGQILLSATATELVRERLPDDTLLRDLGEHRLKDLARPEHIYHLVIPVLQTDFPAIATQEQHPTNLPPQLTSVIGREREAAEIRERLGQPAIRLVTLTGPGGVGKTRLALQLGNDALEDYSDGVWFVGLDQATDEPAVVSEMASAFGVREVAGHPLLESLTEYLRDKQLLVILDNFEQVADAAPLVSRMLRAAPGVQALITSRTRLGLQGEHELVVPPLEVPPPGKRHAVDELLQCSAVSLFVERARATRNGFELTDTNASAVTEICRGLDSLPLAIELAAARVKLLTPEALLSRMEQRLGLLTGGRGDRPARHQTLRATISWSFDLLNPDEQLLFARLAVFAGGFTLEAAETVCDPDGDLDILTVLEALVDHSLIRQGEDATGEPRFSMLTTVREFAIEKLEALADDPTRERHLAWCRSLMAEAGPALIGRDQQASLDRIERDHDNLRAALIWALADGRHEEMLRLAGEMYRFWEMHGYLSEGRRWLAEALSAPSTVPAAVVARALHGLGNLMVHQGDQAEAIDVHVRALALQREHGDAPGTAEALAGLAGATLRQGDLDEAVRLYTESRELYETAGDRWGAAGAINGLAAVAHEQLDYARAQTLYEQGLAAFQALGDQRNIAISLNNLATVAHDRKDYLRASALYEQAAELVEMLEDRRTLAITLNNRAIVAHDQGEYEQAMALYEESIEIFRDLGDRRGVAYLLMGLGIVADDLGEHLAALARHEESMELFQAMADQRGIANARAGMATALLHLGDTERAWPLFTQALAYCRDHGDEEGIVECLDGIARLIAAQGDVARAVRLFAAGAELHDADALSLSPAAQADYRRTLEEARASLGNDGFEQAWHNGLAMTLDDAAADVLQAGVTHA